MTNTAPACATTTGLTRAAPGQGSSDSHFRPDAPADRSSAQKLSSASSASSGLCPPATYRVSPSTAAPARAQGCGKGGRCRTVTRRSSGDHRSRSTSAEQPAALFPPISSTPSFQLVDAANANGSGSFPAVCHPSSTSTRTAMASCKALGCWRWSFVSVRLLPPANKRAPLLTPSTAPSRPILSGKLGSALKRRRSLG